MLRLARLVPRAANRDPRDPLVDRRRGDVREPRAAGIVRRRNRAGRRRELIPDLADVLRQTRDRHEVLSALATRRGFYIPAFYDVRYGENGAIAAFEPKPGTSAPAVVKKAAIKSTERLDPPATSIFTPDTEFGSRFLVEVVRGCANLCRFCWAGYNYLPVRAFPADRILQLAARRHSARAGLVSIALCDHPRSTDPAQPHRHGLLISPASLRLDDLTASIVQMLRESGERSITIAPEAGSDRLRRVINKTVTNQEILDASELIFANGMENLKLYYMIGLPTETDDDLIAIRT